MYNNYHVLYRYSQYDAAVYRHTIFFQVDGNVTLSENIADNGGIKYAFRVSENWQERRSLCI
jgi:predicted metalloendopeptidase